jgi:hypothetical protein
MEFQEVASTAMSKRWQVVSPTRIVGIVTQFNSGHIRFRPHDKQPIAIEEMKEIVAFCDKCDEIFSAAYWGSQQIS